MVVLVGSGGMLAQVTDTLATRSPTGLAVSDWVIIAAYMGTIAYISWRSRKFAGESLENYFLGGRSMPGWMTGVSYAASMMSADSAVAYGGLAAVTGLFVCWWYLSRFGVALFFGAILFAVYWKRLNTFTTLEFYELRFSGLPASWMRLWLALRTSLVAMVAWTGTSLLALVKISHVVLGWDKTTTLAAALPLAVGYVWLSGYLGVVLSNLVQVAVMAIGSLVLAIKVLMAIGGPEELARRLAEIGPTTLDSFPPWDDAVFPAAACLAWFLGTSIGYGGDAAPMGGAVEGQRILSSRSPKEACKMYLVAEVTVFTLVWLVSVPCLAAAVFWPELRTAQTRELAYPMLMVHYLGPGMLGLVFVAMLGGIISVVGDNLNFGSQVLLNDIYRRYLVKQASQRHYMIAGKLAIFIVLGLALLIVYGAENIIDVAIFMVGLSAAEMSANWAQWWWWRFNGWARVAASFGGALVYLAISGVARLGHAWQFWPEIPWWYVMFGAMGLTSLLWLAVTLLTTPERHELLAEFYRRARPPGNWRPFWQASDQRSAARGWLPILRGIALALAGAGAVMAYIVGISRLYVGQYSGAGAMLVLMAVLGIVFWRGFDPYVRSLLSDEERTQLDAAEAEGGEALPSFGLARLLAVVACVVAAVFIVNALVLRDGASTPINLTGAGIAAAVALWSWRKRKPLAE